jgi:hypothetical protein
MQRIRTYIAALAAPLLIGGAAVAVIAGPASGATTFTVTNTADGGPGSDSLRDVLENQINDGDTVALTAGATYTLDRCADGQIFVDAEVTIQGNGATIEQTCDARVLETEFDITLIGVTITGGQGLDGEGGGLRSDAEAGGRITVIDSTFSNNFTCFEGGGIEVETNDAVVNIIRSTFAGNTAISAAAIDMDEGGDLTIVNSTISGNTSAIHGALYGEDDEGTINLVYSTVVGNTGNADVGDECIESTNADDVQTTADPESPANIGLVPSVFSLHTFGSVIALPLGDARNCGQEGIEDLEVGDLTNTVSLGYNYSDDDSCDLNGSTDKQVAADPQLGALATNGGPTMTRLPATTSPLVNAIPIVDCGDGDGLAGGTVTTDQRGVTRPQETGCEIGSVEIAAPPPVVQQPNFTG